MNTALAALRRTSGADKITTINWVRNPDKLDRIGHHRENHPEH